MHGKPILSAASSASSTVLTAKDGAIRSSISLSLSEKIPRSSVASIDATDVPSTCGGNDVQRRHPAGTTYNVGTRHGGNDVQRRHPPCGRGLAGYANPTIKQQSSSPPNSH
eukprot:1962813-Prymnesium_polylepis.1